MEKIVGHKTLVSGSHKPLYESEAKSIWEAVEKTKAKRETDMPTDKDALVTMFQAYQRLKDLGWREACYCPKDGSVFSVIEAGSTGIFDCHYEGKWPTGSYWVHDAGDLYPSRPILFKKKDAPNV